MDRATLGAPDVVRSLEHHHVNRRCSPVRSDRRGDRRPGGRALSRGYADVAPVLAVEVFSPGNTVREIEQERNEFFEAGTEPYRAAYPERQEADAWTGPDEHRILGGDDVLEGGTLLPGFSVPVAGLFANIDLGAHSDS